MLQVTFPEIEKVIQSAGSSVPAAEGHGCLCGALCIAADYSLDRWLDELIPLEGGTAVPPDIEQPLNALYMDTVHALRGDQMEFQPFLPDDGSTLERRTAALSQWCQGFLYGFGTTRAIRSNTLPGSIDEILLDFTNISRAEADLGEDSEQEEQAYAEVVEYLRAAVQLIHDELVDVRHGGGSDPGAHGSDAESRH
jgi:uncharacterized protein